MDPKRKTGAGAGKGANLVADFALQAQEEAISSQNDKIRAYCEKKPLVASAICSMIDSGHFERKADVGSGDLQPQQNKLNLIGRDRTLIVLAALSPRFADTNAFKQWSKASHVGGRGGLDGWEGGWVGLVGWVWLGGWLGGWLAR